MDALVLLIALSPLLILVLLLVRHGRRIQLDVTDKHQRTQQVDNLDRALVQTVLERDRHTCQTCGTQTSVGVDFRGPTPDARQEVSTDDLEARCTQCFLDQWPTLRGESTSTEERDGIVPRIW